MGVTIMTGITVMVVTMGGMFMTVAIVIFVTVAIVISMTVMIVIHE